MYKINIGIITYNRNDELLATLTSISKLNTISDFFVLNKIIIVDNSPAFNTRKILEKIEAILGANAVIFHEEKAGIPFARNKVVELSGDSDFLAFIDDDEVADVNWLYNLVSTQRKYNANVVQGPVIPLFEDSTPSWIVDQHTRSRHKTGFRLSSMATNNTLIEMRTIEKFKPPFDTSLALTGGTDSLLGRKLLKDGYSIIWCNNAIVYEKIPKARTTINWVIQRNFRGGNNYSLQLKILKFNKTKLMFRWIKSTLRVIQGVFLLPLFIVPVKNKLKPLCKISEGIGGLTGLFGYKYEEYKR